MDVACSTFCFTREPLDQALRHIAELEFARVDLGISDDSPHVTPEQVVNDVAGVISCIRRGPTIGFAGITARLKATGELFRAQFEAIAHLAKQLACPVLVIDAAPAGTLFEREVERLQGLERLAALHGAVLTIATHNGTLSEDPDVALQLCHAVPGLGITLDPSHFLMGNFHDKPYDALYNHVRHTHLRDSGSKPDQTQVRIGRGEIEFSRIIAALTRSGYKGSLVVALEDNVPCDMDVEAEVRKLSLMLESLL